MAFPLSSTRQRFLLPRARWLRGKSPSAPHTGGNNPRRGWTPGQQDKGTLRGSGSAPKHPGGNGAAKFGSPPTSQTTKSSVLGLMAAAAAASLSAGAPFGAVFPPGSFLGEAKQTSRAHVLRRNARLTPADKSRKQARFSSHSVSQLLPTLRSQRKYFDGEQRAWEGGWGGAELPGQHLWAPGAAPGQARRAWDFALLLQSLQLLGAAFPSGKDPARSFSAREDFKKLGGSEISFSCVSMSG